MSPRVVPFPETAELKEMASRRSQLEGMLTAEKNRLHTTRNSGLKQEIQDHITWLQKEVGTIDKELNTGVKACEEWQEKDKLLQSTPGVGKGLSTCLITQLPELGILDRKRIAALAGVAPLNRDSGKSHGKRQTWGGLEDKKG